MTYTRSIQIRLSRNQHNQIKANTIANGFESVSSYMRFLALGRDRVMESKIHEIHKELLGAKKSKEIEISKHQPFINI